MKRLYIQHTPLDNKCVSILSEILKANKTMKTLVLYISLLTGGIIEVSDALQKYNNLTVSILECCFHRWRYNPFIQLVNSQ